MVVQSTIAILPNLGVAFILLASQLVSDRGVGSRARHKAAVTHTRKQTSQL